MEQLQSFRSCLFCGPFNSFHCLGHSKNVYDDDDDDGSQLVLTSTN